MLAELLLLAHELLLLLELLLVLLRAVELLLWVRCELAAGLERHVADVGGCDGRRVCHPRRRADKGLTRRIHLRLRLLRRAGCWVVLAHLRASAVDAARVGHVSALALAGKRVQSWDERALGSCSGGWGCVGGGGRVAQRGS